MAQVKLSSFCGGGLGVMILKLLTFYEEAPPPKKLGPGLLDITCIPSQTKSDLGDVSLSS